MAERLEEFVEAMRVAGGLGSCVAPCQHILDILDDAGSDRQVLTEKAIELGLLSSLREPLSSSSTEDCAKAAQLLAELAKTESAREPCVREGVVPPLLAVMDAADVDTSIQTCRALGNICFDNDSGREAVVGHDGVKKLIDLLRSQLHTTSDGSARLRTVACGFLLNLTNTHESIQELVVSMDVLDILKQYLCFFGNDESLVPMVLLCVGSLSDSDYARERMLECCMVEKIAGLVGSEAAAELQDTIIELLANLAENDEMKLQLAQSDLSQHLLTLLTSLAVSADEEALSTEKLAADLVVLILTGDGSMETWYDRGEGRIYKEAVSWLTSDRQHLQTAGALAMGNFARSDAHCIKLVEEGTPEKLLLLLDRAAKPDTNAEANLTLQHAVLSALRNLAIPVANKPKLLGFNIVQRCLALIETDFSAVQFKLLATFRMLVDGQDSVVKMLASHKDFLQKLVIWCSTEDHAGVKGEACRLTAWMIKHCHSSEVTRIVASCGVLPHLIKMAASEHSVMQNEAIMALTLVASLCLDTVSVDIAREELYPSLKVLLTESSTIAEIVANTFTLLKTTASSAELLQLMVIADFSTIAKSFHSHEDKSVKKSAKALSELLAKS